MSILDHFPSPSFRTHQKETLLKIEEAFERGKRFVIVEGPTGCGKSNLGVAAARNYGTSYVCTPKKILQDQYHKDFHAEMDLLKGRANYDCQNAEYKYYFYNCEAAPCTAGTAVAKSITKSCRTRQICDYYNALEEARDGNCALMNFSNLLALVGVAGFKQRDLLVIDECHMLESCLDTYAAVTITARSLKTMSKHLVTTNVKNVEQGFKFLEKLLPVVKERLGELKTQIELEQGMMLEEAEEETDELFDDKELKKMVMEYKNLGQLAEKIKKALVLHEEKEPFIFQELEMGFALKPLNVAHLKDKAFKGGEKVLLMSATVLDPVTYTKSLGIEQDEYEYIAVPSTFPAENRKFIYWPAGKMSYAHIDKTLPKLCAAVAEILDNHPNEKGIIHTTSYKVGEALEEFFRGRSQRLIFQKRGDNQKMLIAKHAADSRPSVLVSPSLVEGVDLKDDLSRFQILCKVPFPSLGDPLIKARMEDRDTWYAWCAILNIVQASGRSIRSPEDYATTYMLDESFGWFLNRNGYMFPQYFRDAIFEVE